MLIILEGVDGAGKSTLAERLADHIGDHATLLHCGPLKGDALKEYEWALREYKPDIGTHIIADRWHVGELIYGPLYRLESKLTPPMARHVEMYLDKLGAHKVVVTAPFATIQARLSARGEDFLQANHVGLVWDFYNEYATLNDWTFARSDDLLDQLLIPARRKEQAVKPLRVHHSYVGSHHPKYLLLGLVKASSKPGRPYFDQSWVPYMDTSSHFLLESLIAGGIRDVGLANALEEDVPALWATLGRPHVIALGPQAEEASRGVPHQTAPHPQRMRAISTPKEYGTMLQELLP